MPRGNGTGPAGRSGQGKMGGQFAAGPGGQCVCPGCGRKVSHLPGQPCNKRVCPKCNTTMIRE